MKKDRPAIFRLIRTVAGHPFVQLKLSRSSLSVPFCFFEAGSIRLLFLRLSNKEAR